MMTATERAELTRASQVTSLESTSEEAESLEALQALIAELQALDMFLARTLPELRARTELAPAPSWKPDHDSAPWLIEELWMREIQFWLAAYCGEGHEVQRLGDADYGALLDYQGIPIGVRVRHDRSTPAEAALVYCDTLVAVARGMPSFELRPETWRTRLGKLFGRMHETTFDDIPFDDSYFVGCEPDLARLLFDAPIRKSLFVCVEQIECVRSSAGALEIRGALPTDVEELAPVFDAQVRLACMLHQRIRALARR